MANANLSEIAAAVTVQHEIRRTDEGHGRAHCRGELGRQQCAQRSACALHVRWLQEQRAKCLTLPRAGGNPCRYFREVQR